MNKAIETATAKTPPPDEPKMADISEELKGKGFTVVKLGVTHSKNCKNDAVKCASFLAERESKYVFGEYTAMGVAVNDPWVVMLFLNGKGAGLAEPKCAGVTGKLAEFNEKDNPGGGPPGVLDPSRLVCLLNIERARVGVPLVGVHKYFTLLSYAL